MIAKYRPQARSGFTLVELMVAMAVTVIIMTVLSIAFQLSMDAMRQVRSAAEMSDQLRAASLVVRRDFSGNTHLSDEGSMAIGTSRQNLGVRVSDQRFDLGYSAPTSGFMFISSPAAL